MYMILKTIIILILEIALKITFQISKTLYDLSDRLQYTSYYFTAITLADLIYILALKISKLNRKIFKTYIKLLE